MVGCRVSHKYSRGLDPRLADFNFEYDNVCLSVCLFACHSHLLLIPEHRMYANFRMIIMMMTAFMMLKFKVKENSKIMSMSS